jgi:hypothetical protein
MTTDTRYGNNNSINTEFIIILSWNGNGRLSSAQDKLAG